MKNSIEAYISSAGGVVCGLITYFIWRSLVPYQDVWLLPGIYLLELMAGALISSVAYIQRHPQAATISWIYSGILAVFIVLAGFSVGFLYIPVFLISAGLSIYSVIRRKTKLLPGLGIFVSAGMIQLAFMLVFIWVS